MNFSARIILCLLFSFLLLNCSQESLETTIIAANSNSTQDLSDIFMVDESKGYAVGGSPWSKGVVLNTSDGGMTWQEDSLVNKKLLAIKHDGTNMITVGIDGYYLRSDLVDPNWEFFRLGFWGILKDISPIENGTSIAVGGNAFQEGHIYLINNEHYIESAHSFEHELRAIERFDLSTLIAVGFGACYKTINEGQSWEQIDIKGDFFVDIDVFNPSLAIIIGQEGSIFLSEDGGENWIDIRSETNFPVNPKSFNKLSIVDKDEIYIVGDNGLIWKSENGGFDWIRIKNDINVDLTGIAHTQEYIIITGNEGNIFLMDRTQ